MADTITQDEINAILWRACDTFRGTGHAGRGASCGAVVKARCHAGSGEWLLIGGSTKLRLPKKGRCSGW